MDGAERTWAGLPYDAPPSHLIFDERMNHASTSLAKAEAKAEGEQQQSRSLVLRFRSVGRNAAVTMKIGLPLLAQHGSTSPKISPASPSPPTHLPTPPDFRCSTVVTTPDPSSSI
jgi:hypothetical protein